MKSKRQTTRAKLDRERKLQEKRELKREKKQAARQRDDSVVDADADPATSALTDEI